MTKPIFFCSLDDCSWDGCFLGWLVLGIFADFEQFKKRSSYFADFEQVKKLVWEKPDAYAFFV